MKPISYDNYYWQDGLVRLRALKEEDWEEGYPSYFDSEARFLLQEEVELPPAETKVQEEYRGFAGFNQEKGRLMFTIETLDGKIVGGLNLNGVDERNGTFGIGIQVHVGERGKGYAFLERRLNKFNSGCVDGNEPSAALHRKLGCMQEGVRRQMTYSDGKYVDWILFGLTREEFLENEQRFSRG